MMMEALDQECQAAIAEVLCDMLLCLINDFKVGQDGKHEQNQRKPFKAQSLHLYPPVLVSTGLASSGEHETTVSSL